jgi:hypothetical protein
MLVLGLGGKPHSGKTVAAETIVKRYPDSKIYSISELICEELGLRREEVRDASILQDHGALRRKENPNYWSEKILRAVRRDSPRIAVIPNVRTMQEIETFRSVGARFIRYTRLNHDGSPYIANDRNMTHPLETELDSFNWDFYITTKTAQEILAQAQTLALVEWIFHQESVTYAKELVQAGR